jgi:SAM-dependent methyltransferase
VGDDRIPGAAATGFEQGAEAYEVSRPSYPAAALACIVGRAGLGPGRRVLDLAAGTGKLTRLLVPSGAEVVAVEPVAAMRAELVAATPGVEALDGTAEAIPLPDASVDAVTVAQAFHWFDVAPALAEIARVLRPGGTLLVVQNERDLTVEWVRRFGDLLFTGRGRPYDVYYETDWAGRAAAEGAGAFAVGGHFACDWEQPCDAGLLVERAASVSVVASLPDDERREVLDRIRDLAATDPELVGRPHFPFPYTTRVAWAHRV